MYYSVRYRAIGYTTLGIQSKVFAGTDRLSSVDASTWSPADAQSFSRVGVRSIAVLPGLSRAVRAYDPAILRLHGLWMHRSIVAAGWRKSTGRPLIVSPHGMLDEWALRNSGWKKKVAMAAFERQNLSNASCIHALNESEAQSIRNLKIGTPIAIIPNGVDFPQVVSRKASQSSGKPNILLFVGRLHPKKGVAELLTAWKLAIEASPELALSWRLVVAGWDDGGYEAELRSACARFALGSHVEFVGPVHGAEKDAILEEASAFVLPSYSEGLPLAILEAWAHGVPVMMTRSCNLAESFDHGAAIEISNEPQVLAWQLAKALHDAPLGVIGAKGRTYACERYSWQLIVARELELFEWLLCGGTRPDFVYE
jgi:poly(glycerol-phosphate) alpha-glucosyltransferase